MRRTRRPRSRRRRTTSTRSSCRLQVVSGSSADGNGPGCSPKKSDTCEGQRGSSVGHGHRRRRPPARISGAARRALRTTMSHAEDVSAHRAGVGVPSLSALCCEGQQTLDQSATHLGDLRRRDDFVRHGECWPQVNLSARPTLSTTAPQWQSLRADWRVRGQTHVCCGQRRELQPRQRAREAGASTLARVLAIGSRRTQRGARAGAGPGRT